jgi:hypothetical protein
VVRLEVVIVMIVARIAVMIAVKTSPMVKAGEEVRPEEEDVVEDVAAVAPHHGSM